MSRRRRRRGNSGGNNLLIILIIGIIIYLLLLQPKNNNKDLIADSNNNNGHDIVAIVVGNTMYSPSPELNTEKSIEDSIKEVFNNTPANETPNIVMYSATSEPKTLEIDDRYNLGPAANSIASQSNLKDLLNEDNRMIDVEWYKNEKTSYNVEIEVFSNDRDGLLADILRKIGETKAHIMGVNTKTTKEIEKLLDTSSKLGLTSNEAQKRLQENGLNELDEGKKESILIKIFLI